jgi:hypothetical protein
MALIFDMFRASAFVFVLLFVAAISLEVQGRDDESLLRLIASASSSAGTVRGETRIRDRAFESRKSSDDSCGPQISIETPACDVVGKGNGYELRKYSDGQVSLMYLRTVDGFFLFLFPRHRFFVFCTFCRCFVCCFFLWLAICFKTVCGSCFKAFVCHLVLRKLKSGAAVKLRCSADQEKPVVKVIYLD